jgi:hypothetical protein
MDQSVPEINKFPWLSFLFGPPLNFGQIDVVGSADK